MNETNSPIQRPLGPLMIDIAGLGLSELERQRLCHPLVGGLILFSRNYQSPEQLEQLTSEVHALREPALPIAIDHEGGRVQRCRHGFTPLPAMRRLGELWERDPRAALTAAGELGLCSRWRTACARRRSVVYAGTRSRLGEKQRHR